MSPGRIVNVSPLIALLNLDISELCVNSLPLTICLLPIVASIVSEPITPL
nr:MAG TPA: Colipase [Caudoviricetes sp.]